MISNGNFINKSTNARRSSLKLVVFSVSSKLQSATSSKIRKIPSNIENHKSE